MFYIIRTWLIFQPGDVHQAIMKRYSQFDELQARLERMGYPDLPSLPKKRVKVFMGEDAQNER